MLYFTNVMGHDYFRSWHSHGESRNSPRPMTPEMSIPCPLKSDNGPYHLATECRSQPHKLIYLCWNMKSTTRVQVSQLSQLNVCTSHVCRMSYQNKNVTNTVVENSAGKTQSSLNEGHGTWEVWYRKGNNSRFGPVIPKILLCRKTRKALSGPFNYFCVLCLRSKNRVTLADNI
jgi:hypothetical protein